jgi:hypothetical protein
MNDTHIMSLPRQEYDALEHTVKTVEERVGKLQAAHRLEVEKLHIQLHKARKGMVIVFHERPYMRGESKEMEYVLHDSSKEFDLVLEGLVAKERKDDEMYKAECYGLRKVLGIVFNQLDHSGFGSRKSTIEESLKLLGQVKCG